MNTSLRRTAVLALWLMALGSLVPLSARTVAQKKQLARTAFDQAERMREALNGRPQSERTLKEYRAVMDAYRKVYYVAPTSNKADAAIAAVAELLADAGRQFNSDKMLQDAIQQYEFLRREYPGSRYRVEALFTIAEIYFDDLEDDAKAKDAYQEFLKHYPHSELAEQARADLAELNQPSEKKEAKAQRARAGEDAGRNSHPVAPSSTAVSRDKGGPAVDLHVAESRATPISATQTDAPDVRDPETRGKRVLVTGIRHWGTPDYTRVAIDLTQEVEYNADRIDNPDRIYFDLHNAKLSSVLVGKSFQVEDGFLKRIRVAQFQPDQARVVLEVSDVADYSVFLLPNPYRLIIDIHGKNKPAKLLAESKPALPVTGDVELPKASVPAVPALGEQKAVESARPGRAGYNDGTSSRAAAPSGAAVGRDKSESSNVGRDKAEPAVADSSRPGRPEYKDTQEARANLPVHQPKAAAAKAPSVRSIANASGKQAEPVLSAKAVIPAPPAIEKPAEKKVVAEERTNRAERKAEERTSPVEERSAGDEARITNGPLPTRHKKAKKTSDAEASHEAAALGAGDRTLIRALGLKIGRIVVDAGHGGHDTGTIGPNGLLEKDLVLDVALRLGKLLETRMGADVTYTRDDDTFIPLETRTAIANQKQADLFISVHANSSNDAKARGVETYYLNFTTSKDALEVAARENSVSDQSIHELQDLVKKIALKDKIDESKEFAADVQSSLYGGLSKASPGIRNRGVKKAPFIVLIGANMPSILAEISFVSNPTDAKKLQTPEWRQKIAESLYRGVAKYVSGLSGLRVAADSGSSKKPEALAARP